jgi:hypothetical protein
VTGPGPGAPHSVSDLRLRLRLQPQAAARAVSDPRGHPGPDPGPGPRFARNQGRSPVPVPDFSKSGTTAATVAGSSSSCRLVVLLLVGTQPPAGPSGCTRASSHQALLGYCLERGPCGIVTVGALGGQTLTRNEASDGSSCHSIAQLIMSDLPVQTSTGMRGGIPTRPAANLIQPQAGASGPSSCV